MEIIKYISNSYNTINSFAATNLLREEFLEKGYAVVLDDENEFQGILTTSDLIKRPHKLVIDCITKKEHLASDDTIFSCLDKFNTSQSNALPIFEENKFMGIVERQNIVDGLKTKINEFYNKSLISQKVKQSFLNNLSHEVRTPLNGLLGFLELINELDPTDDINIEKSHYDIIKKSADRFLLIMNDLIDLALINSGDNINIEFEKINIESIFSDLKNYFEVATSVLKKDISIEYLIPDNSSEFWSDGKKIKHILYHLIDNAVKFSNNKSKIIYGYRLEQPNIVFFVENNGIQITPNKEEEIFEIFNKQYSHKDDLVEGLGIGLPLVKKLSELLNGNIEFISNELKTSFFCSIPLINSPTLKHSFLS